MLSIVWRPKFYVINSLIPSEYSVLFPNKVCVYVCVFIYATID